MRQANQRHGCEGTYPAGDTEPMHMVILLQT